MKLFIFTILLSYAYSTNVTFNVNMAEQDVGDEGPTLWMGHLYPDPGFIMSDEDGDGIWSYTMDLEPGSYTYKFRNGWWTDWNTGSGWEDLLGQDCASGQWSDREVIVSGSEDVNIDPICFSSCSNECIEIFYSNVTFQVDMSDQSLSDSDIVYVQGTFNGWCGYCNPMSDLNDDNIWELTLELPTGEHEYLFTTNGWDGETGSVPVGSTCDYLSDDTFGNYGFSLGEEDLDLGPFCFGTCWDTCQPPVQTPVTFNVDMNNETINGNIYLIGNFQLFPWSTSILPTVMTDEDGDGIYSVTVDTGIFSDDLIEYKFVNGAIVETDEGIGNCGNFQDSACLSPGPDCNNREFQMPSCDLNQSGECTLDPIILETDIFNLCNLVAANAYFSIDLNYSGFPNESYDQCGLNGSWNSSGDEWLGWGLNLTDDNNDGIFTGILEGLTSGNYEYIVFCSGPADNYSGWGHLIHAPVGSDCDFDSSDEYGNYGFTIADNSDIYITQCAGSCDEVCTDNGGGDNETYNVSFDIEGLDDCDFVSITGSFSNWDGWGATNDNNWTIQLPNGTYEFTILCVDTSDEGWYNDIWGNSIQYQAPFGQICDWDPTDEYPNYGFIIDGQDTTVSYCAGSCDLSCGVNDCTANGDANGDGIINVVDIVATVGHITGNNLLTENQICAADINSDGVINVVDIVAMVSMITG